MDVYKIFKPLEYPPRTYVTTLQTQFRKLETNIARKGIARPQSEFHIRVSVSDLYIPMIGLPILLQEICGPQVGSYALSPLFCPG
jgi:hypothetical protein